MIKLDDGRLIKLADVFAIYKNPGDDNYYLAEDVDGAIKQSTITRADRLRLQAAAEKTGKIDVTAYGRPI